MNYSHLHTPAKSIYHLFTACLFGVAALLLAGCATTDTAETTATTDTAKSARQLFFSPSDGTYFGASTPWKNDDIAKRAGNGDATAQYELALSLLGDIAAPDNSGDTAKQALDLMKKATAQGNLDAEVYLGTMYRNGQGIEKNRDEAIRLYNSAIAKGSPWGMFEMGSLFYEHPNRNTAKTLEWFKKAAEAGYPMAQTAYGVFLLEGKDLPKDAAKGEMYMKKAADSGDAFSLLSLGVMHARGMHFEMNLDTAKSWMKKSAEKNYVPAIMMLNQMEHIKPRQIKSCQPKANCIEP